MPKFFKQNLLTSALDRPELPRDEAQAEQWMHPGNPDFPSPDPFYEPVRTLLNWHAPSRPFRKKDRSFYTTVAILIILVSLIAFFAGQVLLIGVLLALLFLVYVLNFIPPEDIEYKISTQGITVKDHFYHWQEMDSFWFSKKDGYRLLNVLTHLRFPAMLIIMLGETAEEEVKDIVARYLPFHEIAPKSLLDKWSEGLQKHFPLENPHR